MIEVRHHTGSYPVRFQSVERALADLPQSSFIVTDENVQRVFEKLLQDHIVLTLPPGEQTKSLIWLERIATWLVQQGASRKSTLVALGGGVIGDLVGFAAATYMRGIALVQIPTTLLSQVDSSVGGKVAVDIADGKNLVGAFYPPQSVSIDPISLETLSLRQMRNGMAEVWKYGFIMDAPFVGALQRAELDSKAIVERCIRHKADVVAEDEFETKGLRAILNFGHTVGHAIEQATGYRKVLHGEAISIGMVAEAILGENLGITRQGTSEVVADCLRNQGLPIAIGFELDHQELVQVMRKDKKAIDRKLAFSLLTEIGRCKLVENVEETEVLRALRQL